MSCLERQLFKGVSYQALAQPLRQRARFSMPIPATGKPRSEIKPQSVSVPPPPSLPGRSFLCCQPRTRCSPSAKHQFQHNKRWLFLDDVRSRPIRPLFDTTSLLGTATFTPRARQPAPYAIWTPRHRIGSEPSRHISAILPHYRLR